MKTIGAAKFKEQCLALMDQLDHEGIVITKRGKPVARLVRYETNCDRLIGSMRDQIEIRGNIFSTGIKWNASDWDPSDESRH